MHVRSCSILSNVVMISSPVLLFLILSHLVPFVISHPHSIHLVLLSIILSRCSSVLPSFFSLFSSQLFLSKSLLAEIYAIFTEIRFLFSHLSFLLFETDLLYAQKISKPKYVINFFHFVSTLPHISRWTHFLSKILLSAHFVTYLFKIPYAVLSSSLLAL